MSTSGDSWSDVGEQFKKLGSIFKRHYEARETAQGEEAVSKGDVEDAVAAAVDGIRQALGAVGDSVTDPELREEARLTAGSFFEALGATLSDLGSEIAATRKTDRESS